MYIHDPNAKKKKEKKSYIKKRKKGMIQILNLVKKTFIPYR